MQVHLGDKPAIAMSQRMSQGIWNGTGPYLSAALLLALATLASSASHVLPSELLPVATAVSLGVLSKGLYSVLSPLVEIRQLSRLSPQQIEEAVDLKEPLQVSVCYSFAPASTAAVLLCKLCFEHRTATAWQQTQAVARCSMTAALQPVETCCCAIGLGTVQRLGLQSLLGRLLCRDVAYSISDKRSCIACTEFAITF